MEPNQAASEALSSLWQVCRHGSYNRFHGANGERSEGLDARNFNASARLLGGDMIDVKESGVMNDPICLCNIATGQYLTGPAHHDWSGQRNADDRAGAGTEGGEDESAFTSKQYQPGYSRGKYKGKWQSAGVRIMKAIKKKKIAMHLLKRPKRTEGVENANYAVAEPDGQDDQRIYGHVHEFAKSDRSKQRELRELREASTYDIADLTDELDATTSGDARYMTTQTQLKLTHDSAGGGFGNPNRTAFGFVAVDSANSGQGRVEDGGFYRIRDQVSGHFVHFPEVPVQVQDRTGATVKPPELSPGSDSFEDVFCVLRVDDDVMNDVYYVQGLSPILDQLVEHIAHPGHTVRHTSMYSKDQSHLDGISVSQQSFVSRDSKESKDSKSSVASGSSGGDGERAESAAGPGSPKSPRKEKKSSYRSLSRLLKCTVSDKYSNNSKQADAMQVGIALCKELVEFLSPVSSTGNILHAIANRRREMLHTFGTLAQLMRVLHNPLVGMTGDQLITAAGDLQEMERVQKGSSLLQALWQEIMKVLIASSMDHQTESQSLSGVKPFLANFFRTFTLHLMYFRSASAAHVLVSLAEGDRKLLDDILKDPDPVAGQSFAGDFRFFLSFLPLSDPASKNKDMRAEYFQVLNAFCIQGNQAVVEVQEMIAQSISGELPLVGRNTKDAAFRENILLGSYHDESRRKRQPLPLEEPASTSNRKRQTERKKLGLKATSAWIERVNDEGTKFYQHKTDSAKVKFKEPDDDQFDFLEQDVMTVKGSLKLDSPWEEDIDEDGNQNYVLKAVVDQEQEGVGSHPTDDDFEWVPIGADVIQATEEAVNKILINLRLEGRSVKLSFHSLAPEWDQSFTNELLNMCETINIERADTTFTKMVKDVEIPQYYEPTLRDEKRYFLLESQMNMMVEVSSGESSPEVAAFVESRYDKNLLRHMYTEPKLTYGLRRAALLLFHNLYLTLPDLVPDGNRPHLIYMWDGGEEPNHGKYNFVKMQKTADSFHSWLVGGGDASDDGKEAPTFTHDLKGFMLEINHLVEKKLPWNGMNSSKRVPFHQKQAEFVLAALHVAKFLAEVRYYSQAENEGKANELKDMLENCVLIHAVGAVKTTSSRAKDAARNRMIEQTLLTTLELVELLTLVKIERDTVGFFMSDYRYFYHMSYETPDETNPIVLSGDHDQSIIQALAATQCTPQDKAKKFRLALREKCPHLTQATPIDNFDGRQIEAEHDKVQEYLRHVFRKFTDTNLRHLEEELLELGRTAPASVSLKAIDLVISLRSRQQSFFQTIKESIVIVRDKTQVRWDDIRSKGQQLFQLVHFSMMDARCAANVKDIVIMIHAYIMERESTEENSRLYIERDYQEICYKEGIVNLLLTILKHDLDDDQLDNDGKAKEPTESQKMLIECLRLLKTLATDYEPVQEIMLHEMVTLLSYKNCLGPLVAANLVLALIPVAESPHFQARMREAQVVALVARMLELYERKFYVAEFLDLLQTIAQGHSAVVEMSVIRENQLTIVTQLMKGGTLSSDLLGKPDLISSWGGFDDANSIRIHDDAPKGATAISVKGSCRGFDASVPGILIGDKHDDDDDDATSTQELHMILKTESNSKDGLTKITLKRPLKFAHSGGTVVVKPSPCQIDAPIRTRSELSPGAVQFEMEVSSEVFGEYSRIV